MREQARRRGDSMVGDSDFKPKQEKDQALWLNLINIIDFVIV